MPHSIVIDASLARAAGHSADPIAMACLEVLDAIRDNMHLMAMSKPLQDEWFKSRSGHGEPYSQYASMYALEWFVKMRSARRVIWIELGQASDVRRRILDVVDTRHQAQVMKDLHLVETALASDMRVLSLDDTVRGYFSVAGRAVNELCSILWLNPRHFPVVLWLQRDAPDEEQYRLCNDHQR